jgi:hypothetical protein
MPDVASSVSIARFEPWTELDRRRPIDVETHGAVFTWILQRLADAGLVKGKTAGIDATTVEVNAALPSIVRHDTGERYGCDRLRPSAIPWPTQSPCLARPRRVHPALEPPAELSSAVDRACRRCRPSVRERA